MNAPRGLLVLLLMVVLVSGGALFQALGLRSTWDAQEAALGETRAQIASLRQRIAEMDRGAGQNADTLPAMAAQDELDAELQFQDRILKLAREHDVPPLSFGGGPMPIEVGHPAVLFSFEFETGHDRAMGFIDALEQQEPAVALHGVWIRQLPIGSLGDVETPVSVRLTLWSFWAAPDEGQGG